MDVSILICTIPARKQMFDSLFTRLDKMRNGVGILVEILYDASEHTTIGMKRNALLSRAKGTYSCFVDDDDDVTDVYLSTFESAIRSGGNYDCVKLIGHYFLNGKFIKPFIHSLKYDKWYEDNDGYYRCPNHLNLIRTSISTQIGYIDVNFQEDADFSKRLLESGLCKTEFAHDNVLYLYYKIQNAQPVIINKRMKMTFN